MIISAPVVRQIFFGFFSGADRSFFTGEDFLYTGLEMLFMALFGGAICLVDRRVLSDVVRKDRLDQLIEEKIFEIELTQRTSIEALASVAEYRDSETGVHLRRIQEYVRTLTQELRYNSPYSVYVGPKPTYVKELVVASVLHDIGKIVIPNKILLKPGRLTTEEFEQIKTHTVVAGEMLARANRIFLDHVGRDSYLALARDIAMFHHEKWDGNGYPWGLKGEEIPLSARIVALCDVYDAVTSERVYKKPWSHEETVKMVRENRGSHFDPVVTDAFLMVEAVFDRIRTTNHFNNEEKE